MAAEVCHAVTYVFPRDLIYRLALNLVQTKTSPEGVTLSESCVLFFTYALAAAAADEPPQVLLDAHDHRGLALLDAEEVAAADLLHVRGQGALVDRRLGDGRRAG